LPHFNHAAGLLFAARAAHPVAVGGGSAQHFGLPAAIVRQCDGYGVRLTYACYLVSQRKNTGFDKFILLTFHIVLSAVLLLPFYPAYSGPVPQEAHFWVYIEVIAVAFTIIPLFLNLYALKGLNSSTVGMLLNINPIIAFALANVVYHEHISLLQLGAYCLIFLAVLVFNAHYVFRSQVTGMQSS
jgi:chloramphenicol-sensitive protein RarD